MTGLSAEVDEAVRTPEYDDMEGDQAAGATIVISGSTPVRSGATPFAICLAVTGAGLLLVSIADTFSRQGRDGSYWLFWAGIVAIVVPVAVRLVGVRTARSERLGLTVMMAMALYIVKVLHAPTSFQFHDEFAHWRNAENVLQSGHLFGFNPLIPATAFYPGLANVTAAVARTSGLSIFTSGILVIGAARLVLVIALFLVVERLVGSRIAGVAVFIYFANPNFLYWDAQYAYESLALPLVLLALYLVMQAGDQVSAIGMVGPRSSWRERFGISAASAGYRFIAVATIGAVIVTHHIAAFALSLLLLAWTFVSWWRHRSSSRDRYAPFGMALLSTAGTLAWMFFVAPRTISYLRPVLTRALTGGLDLILHQKTTRQLFVGGGQIAPAWERVMGIAAVALLLGALIIGLVILLRRRGVAPLAMVLALGSLLYVLLLPLRLVAAGQETANRSSEYVFVSLGLVDGLVVAEVILKRLRPTLGQLSAVAYLTVVFLGGVCVSWAYYERLAPDFTARGVPTTVSPQSIAAANWMRQIVGTDRRVATDLTNSLGLGSYGLQHPLSGATDNAKVWKVFLPTVVNAEVRNDIRTDRVQFILTDHRLSEGVPLGGGAYFDPGEPHAGHWIRPISSTAMTKFDGVPAISRVYDAGILQIYDVEALKP